MRSDARIHRPTGSFPQTRTDICSYGSARLTCEEDPDARQAGLRLSASERSHRPTPAGRLSYDLVGEVGEALADGPSLEEAHWLVVGGLAEETLAGPEHHREDH